MHRELKDFYNNGFGWICKHCERELPGEETSERSRLLTEGEAEGKNPRLSTNSLARWADERRETLVCPRCGMTETIS